MHMLRCITVWDTPKYLCILAKGTRLVTGPSGGVLPSSPLLSVTLGSHNTSAYLDKGYKALLIGKGLIA